MNNHCSAIRDCVWQFSLNRHDNCAPNSTSLRKITNLSKFRAQFERPDYTLSEKYRSLKYIIQTGLAGWVGMNLLQSLFLMCLLSASFRDKLLSQTGHENGFSILWISLCRFKSKRRLKLWKHWWHLKGLLAKTPKSPRCVCPARMGDLGPWKLRGAARESFESVTPRLLGYFTLVMRSVLLVEDE